MSFKIAHNVSNDQESETLTGRKVMRSSATLYAGPDPEVFH